MPLSCITHSFCKAIGQSAHYDFEVQVILGAFLSLAYGANNGHVSMGMFAGLRHISRSGVVPESAAMDIGLRCVLAASMAVGTILWGSRLAPVTGLQLVHTTGPASVP